ncbi:ComF family protein [Chloroflexota bacterium]
MHYTYLTTLAMLIKYLKAVKCQFWKHYTPPQARTTTVEERWSNVTNAFTCISDKIKDKNVLLIDDVSTSGATINACAKALKDAGAALVWGLVLAREV